MTSMDEQGRPETPLAGWDTVGWEADPTGIGTRPPKRPLTGSMRSGRVTNGSSGSDRDMSASRSCTGWLVSVSRRTQRTLQDNLEKPLDKRRPPLYD
jgi:hypothetical protein